MEILIFVSTVNENWFNLYPFQTMLEIFVRKYILLKLICHFGFGNPSISNDLKAYCLMERICGKAI